MKVVFLKLCVFYLFSGWQYHAFGCSSDFFSRSYQSSDFNRTDGQDTKHWNRQQRETGTTGQSHWRNRWKNSTIVFGDQEESGETAASAEWWGYESWSNGRRSHRLKSNGSRVTSITVLFKINACNSYFSFWTKGQEGWPCRHHLSARWPVIDNPRILRIRFCTSVCFELKKLTDVSGISLIIFLFSRLKNYLVDAKNLEYI